MPLLFFFDLALTVVAGVCVQGYGPVRRSHGAGHERLADYCYARPNS
jgi:hypothetical protein